MTKVWKSRSLNKIGKIKLRLASLEKNVTPIGIKTADFKPEKLLKQA